MAWCPDHGIQPSPIEAVDAWISMADGSCPCDVCGRQISLLDGTFRVTQEAIEVLAAPAWTLERLQGLEQALRQAKTTLESDPETALAVVEDIAPEVGGHLRAFLSSPITGNAIALIGVLLAALAILISLKQHQGTQVTPEQVRDIISQVVGQTSGADPAPGSPAPQQKASVRRPPPACLMRPWSLGWPPLVSSPGPPP